MAEPCGLDFTIQPSRLPSCCCHDAGLDRTTSDSLHCRGGEARSRDPELRGTVLAYIEQHIPLNRRRRTSSSVEVLPPSIIEHMAATHRMHRRLFFLLPIILFLCGLRCDETNATGYEGEGNPIFMANDIGKAMSRLKHRDIRNSPSCCSNVV